MRSLGTISVALSFLAVMLIAGQMYRSIGPLTFLAVVPISIFLLNGFLLFSTFLSNSDDASDAPVASSEGDGGAAGTPIVIVPVLVRSETDVVSVHLLLAECSSGQFEIPSEIRILVDFADGHHETDPKDAELARRLSRCVDSINVARTASGFRPARIHTRQRTWNAYEQLWMGYERKRGKIEWALRDIRQERDDRDRQYQGEPPCRDFVFVMDIDSRISAQHLRLLQMRLVKHRSDHPGRRSAMMAPAVVKRKQAGESFVRWITEPELIEMFIGNLVVSPRQAALGSDIYHGKALVHVDDFLDRCTDFKPNTILSHDHIEAALGNGCSTNLAVVVEPFPKSRDDWERRQHRWTRGDFQVLPWLFGRGSKDRRKVGWRQWLACLHIVLVGTDPLFRYLFVLASLGFGVTPGIGALLLSSLLDENGPLLAVAQTTRVLIRNTDKWVLWVLACAVLDRSLRLIGFLFYFQRNGIIAGDAIAVASIRMLNGRKRLLEWYPANRTLVTRRRVLIELAIMAISLALWSSGHASAWLSLFVAAWLALPFVTKPSAIWATIDNMSAGLSAVPERLNP